MIEYPDINPVALSLGPIKVYWYGVMYLAGFMGAYFLLLRKGPYQQPSWDKNQVTDIIFYTAIGVILGGRMGYVLAYQPELLASDPLSLFKFWELGRSFHGGLVGVLVTLAIYARLQKRYFLDLMDFIAPVVPVGLAAGRLGNFINGELWGRVSDVPWAMVFPAADDQARHPSQLYEFFLEGILLWVLLMWFSQRSRHRGAVSGMFLLGYGCMRWIAENYRQPDLHIGFVVDQLTMGQVLSIPMVLFGLILLFYKRENA